MTALRRQPLVLPQVGPLEAVLVLPWPKPPLTKNKRLHYMAEATIRKQIHRDVAMMARATRLRTGWGRVQVELHWRATTDRRRDTDNMADTLKPVIDALVKYGVVADDHSELVRSECFIERGAHDICYLILRPWDE